MTNALLLIDPQNDFCSHKGSLFVAGAQEDCKRLAHFITVNAKKIDSLYVSMDTHLFAHISHSSFWIDTQKNHPAPFTCISREDLLAGNWQPVNPDLAEYAKRYVTVLGEKKRYNLTIWPEHCILGTWGHNLDPLIQQALHFWFLIHQTKNVEYILKGKNLLSEHYSIIQAEVPDSTDLQTQPNHALITALQAHQNIYIAGQALSHCVLNTIKDVSAFILPPKLTLLEDCSSAITGFEEFAQKNLADFVAHGMKTEKSTVLL